MEVGKNTKNVVAGLKLHYYGSNGYLKFIKEQLNQLIAQMDTFEYFYKEIRR